MPNSAEQFEKKEVKNPSLASAQEKVPLNPVSPAMQRMRDMEQLGKAMKMQKLVERICKEHDEAVWPKLDWSKVSSATIGQLISLFNEGFDRFAGINPNPSNSIIFLKNKSGQRREFTIVLNPEKKANKPVESKGADKKVLTEKNKEPGEKRSFDDLKLDWAGRYDQMGDADKVTVALSIADYLKAQTDIPDADKEFEALDRVNEFMDAAGVPKGQKTNFLKSMQAAIDNTPEARAEREKMEREHKEEMARDDEKFKNWEKENKIIEIKKSPPEAWDESAAFEE